MRCIHCGQWFDDPGEVVELCPKCTEAAGRMGAHLLVSLHVAHKALREGGPVRDVIDKALAWISSGRY